jgi:ABC-type lipoprotein export system ATPase subunit
VLADEPTGNLDEETGIQVMDILLRLNREQDTTFIMITHNPSLASAMQYQHRMENGQLHLIANK